MNDGGQAESVERTGPADVRFGIRLDRIETWSVRAQRWEEGEVPEWAAEDGSITINVGGEADSRIVVAITLLARDDQPRAVEAQIAAVYEVAIVPPGEPAPTTGNIADTAAFMDGLDRPGIKRIANQALRDIAPYMREVVQSMSVRVWPTEPIAWASGMPVLPPDFTYDKIN
ncbi:hypothetical protein ACFC06_16295 [Nocardia sp. NPDC056064]|uniref:hypothetical protein n=1 Tax=Nocardia sp. NPDC056064 TaxID=3345701 RepID=UPI0035D61F89